MRSGSGSPSCSSLILASRSPQRRALLASLGLEFDVVDPAVEETSEGDPAFVVETNARAKARAVSASHPGEVVVAGDTEVVLDGRVLGQPADARRAQDYLRSLSGREHEVVGGVAVGGPGGLRSAVELTRVAFREIEPALLDAYVASGEWRGRAGGYAIQGLGSALVQRVEGDLANVIGLPVALLLRLAPELK